MPPFRWGKTICAIPTGETAGLMEMNKNYPFYANRSVSLITPALSHVSARFFYNLARVRPNRRRESVHEFIHSGQCNGQVR